MKCIRPSLSTRGSYSFGSSSSTSCRRFLWCLVFGACKKRHEWNYFFTTFINKLTLSSAKTTESALSDHTIITYYHKEDNEASWESFSGLFHTLSNVLMIFSFFFLHIIIAVTHISTLRNYRGVRRRRRCAVASLGTRRKCANVKHINVQLTKKGGSRLLINKKRRRRRKTLQLNRSAIALSRSLSFFRAKGAPPEGVSSPNNRSAAPPLGAITTGIGFALNACDTLDESW